MEITKSNKHKLSLNHNKPNEKDKCTLATPYALMRSLILDYQITNTSLGSCTPFLSNGCFSWTNGQERFFGWVGVVCISKPSNLIVTLQLSTYRGHPTCSNPMLKQLTVRGHVGLWPTSNAYSSDMSDNPWSKLRPPCIVFSARLGVRHRTLAASNHKKCFNLWRILSDRFRERHYQHRISSPRPNNRPHI